MKDRLKEIELEIKNTKIDIMLYGATIGDYSNEVKGQELSDRVNVIIKTSKQIIILEDIVKLLEREKKELIIKLMSE